MRQGSIEDEHFGDWFGPVFIVIALVLIAFGLFTGCSKGPLVPTAAQASGVAGAAALSDGTNCAFPSASHVTFEQLGRVVVYNDSACRNTYVAEWWRVTDPTSFDVSTQVFVDRSRAVIEPGGKWAFTTGIVLDCGQVYQVDVLRGEKLRDGPPLAGDEFYSRPGGYFKTGLCGVPDAPVLPVPPVVTPDPPAPPAPPQPPISEPPISDIPPPPPPVPCVWINKYHCV